MPDPRHQTALQRRKSFATTFSQFLEKIDKAKCPQDKTGIYDPLTVGMTGEKAHVQIIKPIRDAVREIGDQLKKKHGDDYQKKIEEYTGELTRDKISCDMAFGLFALYASKFVSKEFYEELIIFLALYRKAMDDKGWEKIEQIKAGNVTRVQNESFCATQTAEFVPDISNTFILEYLPSIANPRQVVANPEELRFLGLDDQKLSWAILLITQICHWLYLHGCTQAKLELKQTLT